MLSSPACELKQYIALVGRREAFQWAVEANVVVDTYGEHQEIERADLEVFKCVQVQCVTASSDLTGDSMICDFCADACFRGKSRNRSLRQHMNTVHSDRRRIRCPEGCHQTFGRAYNVKKHVKDYHR